MIPENEKITKEEILKALNMKDLSDEDLEKVIGAAGFCEAFCQSSFARDKCMESCAQHSRH